MAKFARKIAIIFGAVLCLLALSIAGLFIWLRTSQAERWITATLNDSLTDLGGYALKIGSLSGPLPERLVLRDAVFTGKDGAIAKAREIEARISLGRLINGEVLIPLVKLNGVELLRLPPSEKTPAPEPSGPPALPNLTLPVEIQVEKLLVEDAGLHMAAFFGDAKMPPLPAELGPMPELLKINASSSAKLAKGLLSADIDLVLDADTGQNFKFKAQAGMNPEEASVTAEGGLAAPIGGENAALAYKLGGKMAGSLITIEKLDLDGLGLTLDVKGSFQADSGAVSADLEAKAQNKGLWQKLVSQLAGLAPDQALGGDLALSVKAELPEVYKMPPSVSGHVQLQGKNMSWPFPEGKEILGSALDLEADIAGGGAAPWLLRLQKAKAGILSITGQAEYAMATDSNTPASAAQAGVSPTKPKAAPSSDASQPEDKVKAKLEIKASNLEPLKAGIAGQATAELLVAGPINALEAELALSSPALETPAGSIQLLATKLKARYSLSSSGDMAANGKLTLSTAKSPGGPGDMAASWAVEIPSGGTIKTVLDNLRVNFAGLALKGDLKASIPPDMEIKKIRLAGELAAEVKSWASLAALGKIDLKGGPAKLDLRFSESSDAQNAAVAFNLAGLSLPGQGLALRNLNMDLRADRIWNNPVLRGGMKIGPGSAGPLSWTSGTANVDGSNTGSFNLAMRGLKKQETQSEAKTKSPGNSAKKTAAKTSGKPGEIKNKGKQTAPHNIKKQIPDNSNRQVAVKSGGKNNQAQNKAGKASSSKIRAAKPQSSPRPKNAPALKNAEPATANAGTNTGQGSLALGGTYNIAGSEIILSNFSLQAPELKTGLRFVSPLILNFSEGIKARGLKAVFVPGGTLEAEADLKGGAMNLKARLSELPLSFFRMLTDAPLPDGGINAQADFSSSPSGPKGNLSFAAKIGIPAQSGGENLNIRLDAALERAGGGHILRGSGSLEPPGSARDGGGKLNFSLPLSVSADGLPMPNPKGKMTASFVMDSRIAPLWRLAPLPGRSLDGHLAVNLAVSGSMSAPAAKGSVYIAGGRYEDKILGVLLNGLNMEAHGSPEGGGNFIVAAADGRGGSLALEGALKIGTEQPSVALRGQIKQLQPLHRNDLSIMLSGIFSVKGPLATPDIEAEIVVDKGEVTLLSSLGGGGGVSTLDISDTGASMQKTSAGPNCALQIDIPRRFFIRGKGLDSEWQGKLNINGNLSQPVLTGELNPVRGNFEILSKTFKIDKGEIIFTGGDRIDPGLNLELTYTGDDITAIVAVSGSAQKPKLKLSGSPPMAQDEVLAHVLFGKSVSELSQFEAIQLANGIRELSGVGETGFNPLTTMRKGLGLDVLRIGGGQSGKSALTDSGMSGAERSPGAAAAQKSNSSSSSGTPTLEAGKYINDSIYVGVEQGTTQESTGVRVEIELTPNIKLQGKSTPSSSQIGIGWKKDY